MRYRFADCVLDVALRSLQRATEPVALQPQVFDLLVYLVQNRHRVVGRDDLTEAIWGGRIVSESTLASRISAVRSAIGDSGDSQRLLRTFPRKGLHFVGEVVEERAAPAVDPRVEGIAAAPGRASIAVLPFTNLSGEPAQDYFADGIADDITTELARNRSLFVIARNSSFTYKGRSVDVRQVGRELGVRYILEGSVRKTGDRVRIIAQLIDAATGAHLWADRIDGSLDDIFSLQDRVTAGVVDAVEPQVRNAEIRRAQRKPTGSLDAYDYLLRAFAEFHPFRLPAALAHCRAAIALDGDYALAHALAAQCIGWRRSLGIGPAVGPDEATEGIACAHRAVERGGDDPTALWMAGQALLLLARDHDNALALAERALLLCPNGAPAWNASGWIRWSAGDGELAIEHFGRAMRLSPLDPHAFLFRSGIGWAHFVEGRYEEALDWSDRALALQPSCITSLRCKAAIGGLLSDPLVAEDAVKRLLALQPTATVAALDAAIPLRQPAHRAAFVEGLRRAGLPEQAKKDVAPAL